MKNYRVVVPMIMVAVMGLSWYMMIDEAVKEKNVYEEYLSAARMHAEDGTKYALENYKAALAEKSSPELYMEIANYYKEKGIRQDYINWCEEFFEVYPTESLAYECILEAYVLDEDYTSCYDVLEIATKREITSEKIEHIREDIKYVYSLGYNVFESVGVYGAGLCPVLANGSWGFADRYGTVWISCVFDKVGSFSNEGVAPIVTRAGEAYFIDLNGEKVKVSDEKYKSFGLLAAERSVAECEDGTYCYVDSNLNKVFGNYEDATAMNLGRAAVKVEGLWSLVDEMGTEISTEKYVDVKYDEKIICYRNDRIFAAKEADKYFLLDGSGKQVGNMTFQDAKVFLGTMPAAVKIGGKWCFIDANGERISDKTYEDARSFANGLAAVKIDGKWGFIDETETIVIEPQFADTKDFNELGSCFVNTGSKWQLLKLYRLNR